MSLLRKVYAQIRDFAGRTPVVSTFGDLVVGQRLNNINIGYQFNNGNEGIVPFLKKTKITLTGTASQSNSNETAFLESGTGVCFGELQSINLNRYIPGHASIDLETMVFPDGGEVGVDMFIGYGSISKDDFIGFGYSGTTFGILQKLRGVEEFIPQSTWNKNKLQDGSFVFNPLKENIVMKLFGWLGVADIIYAINTSDTNDNENWTEVHRHKTANIDDKPHMSEPSSSISMFIRRVSGTGTNIKIGSSSWYAGAIGERASGTGNDLIPFIELDDIPISANTETHLITVRSKDIFQSKLNSIPVQYGTLTLTSDGNKPVAFRVYKNIADRNTGNWGDYDTNGSVLELSNDATLNITTRVITPTITLRNEQIGGTFLQKIDNLRINLFGEGTDVPITAYPDESITITALSTGASTINLQLRGVEKN